MFFEGIIFITLTILIEVRPKCVYVYLILSHYLIRLHFLSSTLQRLFFIPELRQLIFRRRGNAAVREEEIAVFADVSTCSAVHHIATEFDYDFNL